MKKLLFVLALTVPLVSLAQVHNPALESTLGFPPVLDWISSPINPYSLDAADGGDSDSCSDDMVSLGVFTTEAKTLDKIRVFSPQKTGTIGSNDLTATLYAGSLGVPTGSAITTCNTITSAAASNIYLEWTCFNDALTANTSYVILIKNCNATPASNYVTISRGSGLGLKVSDFRTGVWADRCTNDGGTTWTLCDDGQSSFAVAEYADGTSAGNPFSLYTTPNSATSSYRAYDTRKVGAYFTTPPDAKINSIGAACVGVKSGTPSAGFRMQLLEGSSSVIYGHTTAAADINTNHGWLKSYWTRTELAPNTAYRIVFTAAATGDTSSNGYTLGYWAVENDAESLALRPFGMKFTAYDGSNWTETETVSPICYLILDNSDYFGTQSSGGSNKSSGINGGLN